jgi:hypothetical protein
MEEKCIFKNKNNKADQFERLIQVFLLKRVFKKYVKKIYQSLTLKTD